jgi:mannosyltransferase
VSVQERAGASGTDRTPSTAPPTTWQRRWLPVLALGAALIGTVTRFVTTSALWLDEALSVNIAALPLADIPEALRHDGHPPLYYFLLHTWMEVVGDGDVAVRALSGVLAVVALPVAWLVGRRAGGPALGWLTLLVLALLPFASRYGTEARMYSLVILLVLLGWLAIRSALDDPRLLTLAGVGLCSGLLLLTHYWALYLVAATGALLAVTAWRATGEARRAALRTLVAVAAGGLLFLPWLPSFLDQARHTGTPWASAERPTKVLALTFSDLGGVDNAERILFAMVLGFLVVLGLCGRAEDDTTIALDLRTRPDARAEVLVAGGTLALAVLAGYASSSGFAPRYLAVIVPLLVLAAAWGLSRFTGKWAGLGAIAVLVLVSGLGIVDEVDHQRTQMDDIAAAIDERGEDGDVVVYCPDQLGPAGSRALEGQYDQVTYPDFGDPERVDWVDYADRNAAADPEAFVAELLQRAEGHTIWLAWSPEYVTLEGQCPQVRALLGRARPDNGPVVTADSDEFFENANLHRFASP